MYEQMMNIVRRKRGGKRERGFIVSLQREHTYPVRLNQKRVGKRRWEEGEKVGRGGGWVGEGQKRQDEERERGTDQTQAVRAGIKGKNLTLSGLWMIYNST